MRTILVAALAVMSLGLVGASSGSATPINATPIPSNAGSGIQLVDDYCGYGYCRYRVCGYYGCRYVCRRCEYHRRYYRHYGY